MGSPTLRAGEDVLLLLFQHLDGQDLLHCEAVCRHMATNPIDFLKINFETNHFFLIVLPSVTIDLSSAVPSVGTFEPSTKI